eukprot:TRINITY_DN17414_c1_g1_i1.p1 TRINITY_DN17414_c1_g1~~TRINITY_DN17414_c1_g1_i1.p1  ORF type:complete len:345 (+),score=36.11 TRINITY_DN17414_c1_g1_i1:128-1162(+)
MHREYLCSDRINIKVKVSGGKVIVLEGLTGDEFVGELVAKVAAQIGVQPDEWTWVKDRVELGCGTISQCGLLNGDCVRMVTLETLRKRRLRRRNVARIGRSASVSSTSEENSPKCLQVRVRTSTSKVLKINVNPSDTMNSLLSKVKAKLSLSPSEQCLAIFRKDDLYSPIPATDTVEDCRLTSKSLLVLVPSNKAVGPYPTVSADTFEDISLPNPVHVEKERGVRVRLGDGKIIRLRNVTFSMHTVSCLLEVLRTRIGQLHNNECLAYQGNPLDLTLTLEANGVPFNEIITLQSSDDTSQSLERLPSVMLVKPTTSSPLCQFTLCSLSPIFGPVNPPFVSLPAC